MNGSSQVNKMWDSSQVNKMWDSSQVNEMWGSSQVNEMKNRTTTIRIFGVNIKLPTIKLGVIIDFSKSNTRIIK